MGSKKRMKNRKKVSIKVPGSTSNLGPGFDTLGLAINLFLKLEAETSDKLQINVHGEGEKEIPKNNNNLIYRSYQEYFKYVNEPSIPIRLSLKNEIPLKRGLGSSGAAIVGGILTARKFANKKVTDEELLNIAASVEGHADNVTPSLFGGLNACCMIKNKVIASKIKFPKRIKLIAVIPDLNISTKKARAILPKQINFKDAVFNVQRISLLLNSFYTNDFDNMKYYLCDKLHQDYRKEFVPGFDSAVKKGVEAGALGIYLSGSGPTIMAFCKNNNKIIAKVIVDVLKKKNIACRVVHLKPVFESVLSK